MFLLLLFQRRLLFLSLLFQRDLFQPLLFQRRLLFLLLFFQCGLFLNCDTAHNQDSDYTQNHDKPL